MTSWLLRSWTWLTTSNIAVAQMEADHLHLPSLDGSRAVSILLVLLAHYVSDRYFPGGLGVQIFFVISGLLITRLMLSERKRTGAFDIPDFLLRRGFRLYPVLFVCCLFVSVQMLIFARVRFDWHELVATLFYGENYFTTWRQAIGHPATMPFTPFWSLSVEEQFYLGFALMACFWKPTQKRVLIGAVIATLVPPFIRLFYAITTPAFLAHDSLFIYAHTETRIDSIAAGVMIAAACEFETGRRFLRSLMRPLPVLAASVVIGASYAPGLHNEFFRDTWRFTLVNLSIAVLLSSVIFSDRYWIANWILNWNPVQKLGVWSYSVYIWHAVVGGLLSTVALPLAALAPIKFIVVIAVSGFSYTFIEKPAKEWREPFKRFVRRLRGRASAIKSAPPTSKSAS